MAIQNDAIYSLPYLYISGLDISIAGTKVIAVSPGQCRDINDKMDMPVGYANLQGVTNPATLSVGYRPPLFINCETTGANGLDFGTLSTNFQYAVYLIGDSRGYNNVAGIMCLAAQTSPIMPSGYDSQRLLGFVSTNGSVNFVFSTNKPQLMRDALSYGLSPAVSVLSGGSATSFTEISLNSAIPLDALTNVIATLSVTFIPASAGSYAQFRATDSQVQDNIPTISAVSAGVAQTQYISVICGVDSTPYTSIDYLVSSSSDSLTVSVVGYTALPLTAYPA